MMIKKLAYGLLAFALIFSVTNVVIQPSKAYACECHMCVC